MEYKFYNENWHPKDFHITFEPIQQKEFLKQVTLFASFPIESQIGRRFYFVVKNHDRFDMDNLFEWWLKKSTKRYDKLNNDGNFRNDIENYGDGPVTDMIR